MKFSWCFLLFWHNYPGNHNVNPLHITNLSAFFINVSKSAPSTGHWANTHSGSAEQTEITLHIPDKTKNWHVLCHFVFSLNMWKSSKFSWVPSATPSPLYSPEDNLAFNYHPPTPSPAITAHAHTGANAKMLPAALEQKTLETNFVFVNGENGLKYGWILHST